MLESRLDKLVPAGNNTDTYIQASLAVLVLWLQGWSVGVWVWLLAGQWVQHDNYPHYIW